MPETDVIKGLGWMATSVGEEYDLTFDPGGHVPQDVTVRIDQEALARLQAGDDFDGIVLPLMRAQGVRPR